MTGSTLDDFLEEEGIREACEDAALNRLADARRKERRQRVVRDDLWDADPNCQHSTVCAPGGGIKCTKCRGWFCF